MQLNQNTSYFEFRQARDLGDIITLYFDFLKQNFKSFLNIFISYNGIFMIALLGISYLLVSGFMGLIAVESGSSFYGDSPSSEEEYLIYMGIGGILFILVFIAIGTLNYSLASSYSVQYVEDKAVVLDKEKVWKRITSRIGDILLFIFFLLLIYGAYMIVSVILAFIPLLGALVQYVIAFAMTSWLGISFMVMLQEQKSPTEAYGEGWDLVKSSFWKCVGTNFILGMLVGLIVLLLLMIPGIVVGAYSYIAIDTGASLTTSLTAKIVYTLGVCLLLIIMAFSQCLSQFVNAMLYYAMHEELYNESAQERINQIGEGE